MEITDFRFKKVSSGRYKVTYTSPITGKSWSCETNNMPLIDDTMWTEIPKKKDLEHLKKVCKGTRI